MVFLNEKLGLLKMQLLGLLQKMISKLTFIQRILRNPPCPAKKKSSLVHNPTPPHHPKALTFFLTWDESTISETSTLSLSEKVEGTSFCVEAWKLLQILWHVLRKANWVEYIDIHLFFLLFFHFLCFSPRDIAPTDRLNFIIQKLWSIWLKRIGGGEEPRGKERR